MAHPHIELAYISATLKGAAERMPDRERIDARARFEHWRDECTRLAPEHRESVAATVHEVIDERMAHMLKATGHGRDVQCRKGCGACCHLQVDVFDREAELLLMMASEQGIEIDEAKLARQASKANTDAWNELSHEDRACVFLAEDQSCRVHEHRPGACRKYLVKSPAEFCDTTKYPGGRVAIVFDVEAEIVQSAAMTVYGAGSMAAKLLAALKR